MRAEQSKSVRLESSIGLCPSCQQTVKHSQSQQIKRIGDVTISHGPCQACAAPLIVLTVQSSMQTTAIGLITDCSRSEITTFWGKKPLSEDDIIALHSWLEQPLKVTQLRTE